MALGRVDLGACVVDPSKRVFPADFCAINRQQGASMSLSDAERDALEQLQEAVETGDLSLLRKLLNQTDLTNYPFAM